MGIQTIFALLITIAIPRSTLAKDACELISYPRIPGLSEPLQEHLAQYPFAHQLTCDLNPTCPETGANPFWAQRWVDGDLMLDAMELFAHRKNVVKAAIVDTGVDKKFSDQYFKNPIQHYLRITKDLGFPDYDPMRHGTKVGAIFGGPGEMGLSLWSEISIYGVALSQSGDARNQQDWDKTLNNAVAATQGKISDAALASALQACKDGNEVVNVSSGVSHREKPEEQKKWQDDLESILPEFQKRGCLLVNSAGNDQDYHQFPSQEPRLGYISVQASDQFGLTSDFSSRGALTAPGSEMLLSDPSYRKTDVCGIQNVDIVSGTSFAGPLTAAIATGVIAILKTSAAYTSLKGEERLDLQNKILQASVLGRTVNALRAVEIAKNWVSSPPKGSNLVDKMRKELTRVNHMFCSRPLRSDCPKRPNCLEQKTCIKELRKHLALCTDSTKDLNQAIQMFIAQNDYENAAKYYHSLDGKAGTIKGSLKKMLTAFSQSARNGRTAANLVGALRFYKNVLISNARETPEIGAALRAQFQAALSRAQGNLLQVRVLINSAVATGTIDTPSLSRYLASVEPRDEKEFLLALIMSKPELFRSQEIEAFFTRLRQETATVLDRAKIPADQRGVNSLLELENKALGRYYSSKTKNPELKKAADLLLEAVEAALLSEAVDKVERKLASGK